MSTVNIVAHDVEIDNLRRELAAARQENTQLRKENERLQDVERKAQKTEEQLADVVSAQDLIFRVMKNPKMAYAYKFAYIAMVDLYPGLSEGLTMQIQPWKIREHMGWAGKNCVGEFLSVMQSIGALTYTPGDYNKENNERQGTVTPNPEIFPYPENFNTKDAEKTKKARDAEKKKRDERNTAWRLYQCEVCGSPDIKYGLHPKCGSCGHEHPPVENIDANRITVAPDENESIPDDWDMPAESAPAPKQPVPTGKCPTCHEVNWSESGECITCWIYGGGSHGSSN